MIHYHYQDLENAGRGRGAGRRIGLSFLSKARRWNSLTCDYVDTPQPQGPSLPQVVEYPHSHMSNGCDRCTLLEPSPMTYCCCPSSPSITPQCPPSQNLQRSYVWVAKLSDCSSNGESAIRVEENTSCRCWQEGRGKADIAASGSTFTQSHQPHHNLGPPL